MKNQNNKHLQTILLAAIATIFIFGAFGSTFAQNGIGAKYGSRDPRPCVKTKATGKCRCWEAIASVIATVNTKPVIQLPLFI